MNTTARRTKILTFRLSEREYRQLVLQVEQKGARNLSSFARDVLCDVARGGRYGRVEAEVDSLADTVAELRMELADLRALVGSLTVTRGSSVAASPNTDKAGISARSRFDEH